MTIEYGRNQHGPLKLTADVVIVGSGAGGAVTACELAHAGLDVLVLEEGGHVPPEEHARMRPSESLRHLWREGGLTMALGVGDSPMINVMMGRGVGGSSALTGGVCFRIPEVVLTEWVRDLGLTDFRPDRLEEFYAEVERACHIKPVPRASWSRSTKLFDEGARKLGHPLEPMRRNTKDCVGWASCNFGCPERTKMSVDISYLPRARAAGARIWTDCLVEEVLIEGSRAVGVIGKVLNGPNGAPHSTLEVRARRVVISAGAYYSPLILKKSGVGRRSGEVGRNLSLHPAFRIMARFDEKVEGWNGALQSAFSSHFEPEGIQLNSVFVPGGIMAATQPGIGSAFRRRTEQIPNLAIFGANLHDLGGGVVRNNPFGREPFVTYRMAKKDRAAIPRAMRIAGETFLAAGAKEIFLPILGIEGLTPQQFDALDLDAIPARRLECTSQHPLGTCRMGSSPESSVVDENGESWEVEGLFVCDGSTVPTSLGVNPQLTIMTLATRFAWRLADRKLR